MTYRKQLFLAVSALLSFVIHAQNDYQFRVVNKGMVSVDVSGSPEMRGLMGLEVKASNSTIPVATNTVSNMTVYISYPKGTKDIQGVINTAGLYSTTSISPSMYNCTPNPLYFSSGSSFVLTTSDTDADTYFTGLHVRAMNVGGVHPQLISSLPQNEWIEITEFITTVAGVNNDNIILSDLSFDYQASSLSISNPVFNFSTPVTSDSETDFRKIFFKGSYWTQGSGTDQIPTSADAARDAQVETSGGFISESDAELNNIEIWENADLTINVDGGLKINGSFTNSNTVDVEGSFVIDATSGGYGQYWGPATRGTIRQYMGLADGWRNVGLPFSEVSDLDLGGAPVAFDASALSTSYNASPDVEGNWGNTVNTVNIYEFIGGNSAQPHEWYGVQGLSSNRIAGYNIYVDQKYFTNDGIIEAAGVFYDPTTIGSGYSYSHENPHEIGAGSQSAVNVSNIAESSTTIRKNNWDGWALVSNPYPCNLNVSIFEGANGITASSIRIWDRTETFDPLGNYKYVPAITEIPPLQAFWIKIGSPATSTVLDFSSVEMRTFNESDFLKTKPIQVELKATSLTTSESNIAHLFINPLATQDYDKKYDAYLFSQAGAYYPNFGFKQEFEGTGNKSINSVLDHSSVPYPTKEDHYPIIFSMEKSGDVEWSIDKSLLPPGVRVYIEDKLLSPGSNIDITEIPYTFYHNAGIDSEERFVIHFASKTAVTRYEEDLTPGWQPVGWFNQDGDLAIAINGSEVPGSISVIVQDFSGRTLNIESNLVGDEELIIPTSCVNGVYLISVKDEKSSAVKLLKVTKSNL